MSKIMLNIGELSFWERQTYFEGIDFLVIGAGIVGSSCALSLRNQHPNAKIVVIERGFLPSGASTKNAGFACFGSPTELISDLESNSSDKVWSTVSKRWEGLLKLRELLGDKTIDFQQNGSWDILTNKEKYKVSSIHDKLEYLNKEIYTITKETNTFIQDGDMASKFGFQAINTSFFNKLEGQIDTGKMMLAYSRLLHSNNILQLQDIEVVSIDSSGKIIHTNRGEIKTNATIITVNGFAKQFIDEDVQPARAQVIVTSPVPNLQFKGTFHYDEGYYYFRNFGNRILLGGGRNIDFHGETTTTISITDPIINSLKSLLNEVIIPNQEYTVDYQWAGIMGVGQSKEPIIKKINDSLAIGVRLGGMGVAIGTLVGQETASLFD